MRKHDTPVSVAEALVRWTPERCRSVLDPAVGMGALVDPLVRRAANAGIHLTCVDVDADAVEHVRTRFAACPGLQLDALAADFLGLDETIAATQGDGGFDCVIMNPPFDGRRWICAKTIDPSWEGRSSRGTRLPIEAAFVLKALRLLREGGRILAIVPPSVVLGAACQPLRELLLRSGRFVCVHELPPFTFERIEARIYLLVWEKGSPATTLSLLNHDLAEPEELQVAEAALDETSRLDHSFYLTRLRFDEILTKTELLWSRLGDLVEISRGTVSTPFPTATAVHLPDFDGVASWRSAPNPPTHDNPRIADGGDILLSRVGRSALRAIGRLDGRPSAISDCVLRLRPIEPDQQIAILLGLRVLFAEGDLLSLVQRRSGGARFVRVEDVRQIYVPMGLPLAFPREFSHYRAALRRSDIETAVRIEARLRAALGLGFGSG